MESTECIFNPKSNECKGPKRMQLNHLMCCKHLAKIYGLQLAYHTFETEMDFQWVGGHLRPTDGTIFKKDCVIIPDATFFDAYYNKGPRERNYTMNPRIEEFMREYANGYGKPNFNDLIFTMEMIRNVSTSTTDSNLGQLDTQNAGRGEARSKINAKKVRAATKVKEEYFWEYISRVVLLGDEALQLTDLPECMAYMLSKCKFSYNVTPYAMNILIHNAVWKNGVGLVATENIYPPHKIYIFGVDHANDQYLNETVNSVPKKTLPNQRVSLADIPESFNARSAMLGSGKPGCAFG